MSVLASFAEQRSDANRRMNAWNVDWIHRVDGNDLDHNYRAGDFRVLICKGFFCCCCLPKFYTQKNNVKM